MLDLTPDELLTTTRAVRRRLDRERPVAREVVEECLRIAFQAPTGGSAQNWAWVVVDDPEVKRAMADIYRRGWEIHEREYQTGRLAVSHSGVNLSARRKSPLNDILHEVPVLLVPAYQSRFGDLKTALQQGSHWGSILPAVWSFMLALRSRGMGSTWTTLHLHLEGEMAELLNIPPAYTQAGLFPVAYTKGTDFKAADRSFSEGRIFWNRCALDIETSDVPS